MHDRVKVTAKKPEARKSIASQAQKSNHNSSISSPIDQILSLQRTIGNRAVQRLFKSGAIQAKLKVGQPGDIYEQEADRVAEQVMRMPEPGLQRQVEPEEEEEEETLQPKPLAEQITPLVQVQRQEEEEEEEPIQAKLADGMQVQRQEEPEEEEETLQAKPLAEQITPLVQRQVEPEEEEEEEAIQTKLADGMQVQRQEEPEEEEEEEEPVQTKQASTHMPTLTPNIPSRIQSLKGGGQPLPQSVRTFFEPRFGYDFSHVRVHTDAEAAGTAKAVNARAFTNARDIVFGSGQYVPGTMPGKKLLAHELTHVVQQSIQGKDSETVQRQPSRSGEYKLRFNLRRHLLPNVRDKMMRRIQREFRFNLRQNIRLLRTERRTRSLILRGIPLSLIHKLIIPRYSYIRLIEVLGKTPVTTGTNPLIDKAIDRFTVMKYDPRTGYKANYSTPPQWFWSPNKNLEPSLNPAKVSKRNCKGKTVMQKLNEWGIPIRPGEVIVNTGGDLIWAFNRNYNLGQLRKYSTKKSPTHCNDFVYDSIDGIKKNIPMSSNKHYWGPKNLSAVKSIFQNVGINKVKPGDVMFQPRNGPNGHMEIVRFRRGQHIHTIGNQGIKRRWYSPSGWNKMIFMRLK